MKIILINGPPRTGKDSSAGMLTHGDPMRCRIGFADHLKIMVHTIYLGRAGADLDPNEFDGTKDVPWGFLGGVSWRARYIDFSENVIKPRHGKEWFGERLVDAARASCADLVVVPDSGFVPEAEVVVREFGPDHVQLIRLHRPGFDFKGDSRGYISLDHVGVPATDITNDGSLQDLRRSIEAAARW